MRTVTIRYTVNSTNDKVPHAEEPRDRETITRGSGTAVGRVTGPLTATDPLGHIGGKVRFPFIAAAILVLALIACNGPGKPASNTLIETPEYTGVIFSENAASKFSFFFDEASTEYWQPSIDDVSRAEKCIRQTLVSVQQDPNAYQREDAAFILENLKEYRRQYVGIVVDGEKRIWCNAFFFDDSYPDWINAPVYVLDGGRDFWQIEYVPHEDKCISFHIHGEA
jgi:hypothetical protein